MDRNRWQRLEQLFGEAQSLSVAERDRLLARECAGDPGLRREVEKLLAGDDAADGFIENAVATAASGAVAAGVERDGDELGERLQAALVHRYRVTGELGRGGSAIVFEGFDEKHEREVAIKVLHTPLTYAASHERFVREIKLAAGLAHPHILPVYDSGDADGLLYYVMPRAQGMSLADRIRRGGRVPVDEAVAIAQAVLSALDYAHRNEVVHRDIKPENILLHDATAIVTDFGIGKALSTLDDERLTGAGAVIGTPAYMSPEQILGDRDLDGRSDIYSTGCVLYEMLTGAPPFNGDSVTSVTRQRLVEDPPSLAERCDGIPEALESAVRTALAREAGDRFASAREFAEALLGAATGTGAVPRRREAGGPDEKSIAILPLVNRTRAAEDDYLSDGISEELIRLLSSVEGLRVVARSSSFSFKGKPGGARVIGQKLGVGAVLEGSLQRSGGRLRIRIQLVHVADGSDLWSERYDRAMEDIFTVEDDIAQSVAGALKVRLLPVAGSLAGSTDEVAPPPDTQGRVFRPPVSDVRAYECYLRARQEIFHFTEAALSRAVEYLNKGLAIGGDGNVFLLSALGYAYWQHINAGISTDPGYLDRAQACADRIFATAADSPHGHRLSGLVAMHRGQPDLAVVHLTRALGHDPNDTDALFWLTLLHGFRGHPRRAAPLVERLISIDPLTALHQMLPGFLALMEGEFERACEPFRNAHGMDPANPVLRLGSGQALAMAGRLDEACEVLSRLREEMPGVFFAQLGHFLELALRGEQQALALVDVELAAAAEPDLQYCWTLAQGFALVGAADEAIEWLRRALQAGFSNYPLLAGSDPLLRNLRGGDAFETLMQDVKRAWEKAGVTDA